VGYLADGRDIPIGHVTTPRVRQRTITSTMTPPAATLNTVTKKRGEDDAGHNVCGVGSLTSHPV
jgi:hypothetical protein